MFSVCGRCVGYMKRPFGRESSKSVSSKGEFQMRSECSDRVNNSGRIKQEIPRLWMIKKEVRSKTVKEQLRQRQLSKK
jgi:hypothetical protein